MLLFLEENLQRIYEQFKSSKLSKYEYFEGFEMKGVKFCPLFPIEKDKKCKMFQGQKSLEKVCLLALKKSEKFAWNNQVKSVQMFSSEKSPEKSSEIIAPILFALL